MSQSPVNSELSPIKRALVALKKMGARLDDLERHSREPIAVIGMACRFPGGANSPNEYWNNLTAAKDSIVEVPPERWNLEDYYDADMHKPGRMTTRYAGLIDNVYGFDAHYFGVSSREALRMDPQQRIMLELAIEACEDAGIPTDRISGSKTGVFLGVMDADYSYINRSAMEEIDAYSFVSTGVIANRVSFFLNLHGPSFSVETQCSSSLVSIYHAVRSLRNGDCDMALAGGSNLILTPHITVTFTKWGIMTPDGRCKTFDSRANGIVRGEGAGLIVLKRLKDAIRDKDDIIGLIRGAATNHDGRTNVLTAPNGIAQRAVIRAALENAGVAPEQVTYVETHGTGTSLGDPIEVDALLDVYGAEGSTLHLGAVKTNIGHLEGAAGSAAIIKALLCLKHKQLPKNLHFKSLNPEIQIADTRFRVLEESVETWHPDNVQRRFAGVSAFGAGGANAHLVLEEAPELPPAEQQTEDGQPRLFTLSAKSEESLRRLASANLKWLNSEYSKNASLADICYTSNLRRFHHEHRLSFAVYTRTELQENLKLYVEGQDKLDGLYQGRSVGDKPKLAFVCSGQGSNFWPISAQLMQTEPAFREALERCDEAHREFADWSIIAELQREDSRMSHPRFAQAGVIAYQIAIAALWRSRGITPDAVIGHSLGEASAAYISGALSLSDVFKLVNPRGQLMERLQGRGLMAIASLSFEEADNYVARHPGKISIAAFNSPGAVVFSGDPDAILEVLEELKAAGVFAKRLEAIDLAGHSPQVEEIQPKLRQAILGLSPRVSKIPFISTVTGARLDGQTLNADYWLRNIREPVRFSQGIASLLDDGFTLFVEIAPHPALAYTISQCISAAKKKGAPFPSLHRDRDKRQTFTGSLGGLFTYGYPIDFSQLQAANSKHVRLPVYQWQHESFVPDYDPATELSGTSSAPRKATARRAQSTKTEVEAAGGLNEILSAVGEARREAIEAHLLMTLANTMQTPAARLDRSTPLNMMGMESFMAVEASSRLVESLGVQIPAPKFTGGASLTDIADLVSEKLAVSHTATSGNLSASLSQLQRAAWLQSRLLPHDGAGNVSVFLEIEGELNRDALEKAYAKLLNRESLLQSIYLEKDGEPLRVAAPELPPDFLEVNIGNWSWNEFIEQVKTEALRPFDLKQEHPIRIRIGSQTGRRHHLLACGHRIALDEEALHALLTALFELYDEETGEKPADASRRSPPSYEEYVTRESQAVSDPAALAFWRSELLDAVPLKALTPGLRKPTRKSLEACARVNPPPQFYELAKSYGDRDDLVLLAAFLLILRNYSGQEDFVIGRSFSLRQASEKNAIAPFTNYAPMRVRVASQANIGDFVQEILAAEQKAQVHSTTPLLSIVEAVAPLRYPERPPLFQIVLETPQAQASTPRCASLKLSFADLQASIATVDFRLSIVRKSDGFTEATLFYDASLFESDFIDGISQRIEHSLQDPSLAAQMPITDLSYLTEADHRALGILTGPLRPISGNSLSQEFETSVRNFPGAAALAITKHGDPSAQETVITYELLNRLAESAAAELLARGLQPGECAGLCMPPGAEAALGMLAILKAGGLCAPIAPDYSDGRVLALVEQSAPKILLVCADSLERFSKLDLNVELHSLSIEDGPTRADFKSPAGALDAPAFKFYSWNGPQSQATVVNHRLVLNSVQWQCTTRGARLGARTLLHTSCGSFDGILEIFSTLLSGGALICLRDDNDAADPGLNRILSQHQIERVFLTPAQLTRLTEGADEKSLRPAYLREIIISGKRLLLSQQTLELLSDLRGCTVRYQLSMPETGVIASYDAGEREAAAWSDQIPIGRPIQNVKLSIINRFGHPAPPGVTGELVVAGAADAQIPTGLVACLTQDGFVRVTGSLDNVADVRKVHIDLDGIECALEQHPAVQQALVVQHKEIGGNGLIAYIVSDRIVDRLTMLIRCRVEFKRDGAAYSLITQDISATGLSIQGALDAEHWKIGASVKLQLILPGISDEFEIDGEVIWTQNTRAGIRFNAAPVEKAALKLSLDHIRELEEASFADSRLLESRVPLRRSCTVEISPEKKYRTETTEISGSGVNVLNLPEEYDEGAEATIRMRLPGVESETVFPVRLSWKDKNRTGFTFTNLDEQRESLLRNFLGHFSRRRLLSLTQLRRFLRGLTPYYSIPVIFVILDRLPLLPDGSINFSALRFPLRKWHELQEAMKTPRSSVEGIIMGIWKDALGVDSIGLFENFFDLGGTSLSAVAVIQQLREHFNIDLPLSALHLTPTIADLAAEVIQKEIGGSGEQGNFIEMLDEVSEQVIAKRAGAPGSPLNNNWIVRFEANAQARLRLFCFSYAGGSARAFSTWWKDLPDDVEVVAMQLPGRDERMLEQPFTDFFPLIQALQNAILPLIGDLPFVFFGHSLGSLLAFELARHLKRQGLPEPERLLLSAGLPPNAVQTDASLKQIFEKDTVEFAQTLNGIPDSVLKDQGLMRIVIPILRTDLNLIHSYHYLDAPTLDRDITVFAGSRDLLVPPDLMMKWRELTTGGFESRVYEGDHFFIHSCQATVLAEVTKQLEQIVRPRGQN